MDRHDTRDNSTSMLTKYMNYAENFIELCEYLNKKSGVKNTKKLERRIHVELRFLKTLTSKDEKTQENQLKSSNLNHYAGVLHAAVNCSGLKNILYTATTPGKDTRLVVDVVCEGGHCWMKVIARKAQALHLMWAGQGQFGTRDLVRQAQEYLDCAEKNPFNYVPPKVHFAFYNGVTFPMAEALEKMGIVVWGQRVEVDKEIEDKLFELDSFSSDSSDDEDVQADKISNRKPELSGGDAKQMCRQDSLSPVEGESSQESNILSCDLLKLAPDYKSFVEHFQNFQVSNSSPVEANKVNLDITTLINLASNVCRGSWNFVFEDDILTQQAAEERENPCLQSMLDYMKGKDLYVCRAAVDDFTKILETLGGEDECRRAKELLKGVTIVENQPSARAQLLPETSKIKPRSKIIFGTGDELKAITMTSNSGFVRAAEHQGVKFAVYLHPSRALTQSKEKHAEKVAQAPSTNT